VLDRPERSERENGAGPTPRARRWKFIGISAALMLAMLWGFRYELRNVSPTKRAEVLEGVGLAFALLAGLGFIFWRVTCYLKQDATRELSERGSGTSADDDDD
jgi:hypothetical protein